MDSVSGGILKLNNLWGKKRQLKTFLGQNDFIGENALTLDQLLKILKDSEPGEPFNYGGI